MNRSFLLPISAVAIFLFSYSVFLVAQPAQANPPADSFKATADRLQSLTTVPLPEWRTHADVPHPEDARLDDADWQTLKLHEEWDSGPRVLRRWIEIPERITGYATQGSRAELNLVIRSNDALILTVFVNGGIVYRGDEDMQQSIPLTENARPGQKFLVAIRIDCAKVKTSIFQSELAIRSVGNRPDPAVIRMEILSAQPVIGAYEDGKAAREAQLEAAANAIDFSLLERGDQAGFDRSLNEAQTKLVVLKPYLQQFKIHAVGNSHIDMAWFWPWTETVEVVRNT
jgi:alpha-mannosidase